ILRFNATGAAGTSPLNQCKNPKMPSSPLPWAGGAAEQIPISYPANTAWPKPTPAAASNVRYWQELTCRRLGRYSAFDPHETLDVHCSNGFDAGFSPYQSAR